MNGFPAGPLVPAAKLWAEQLTSPRQPRGAPPRMSAAVRSCPGKPGGVAPGERGLEVQARRPPAGHGGWSGQGRRGLALGGLAP